MNSLITKALETGELQLLFDFPRSLENKFEQEIITWISIYTRDHGSPPTVERLTKEFSDFLPIRTKDPISDLYNQELLSKKRLLASDRVTKIVEQMEDEHYDPTDDIRALGVLTSAPDSGIIQYSKFDREEYFRPWTPLLFHFPIIDRVTGGLVHGDLCYLVGRLGVGKSTTAQWIVHNWWRDNKRIFFISNEMTPIDILIRLDAMAGHFNPLALRLRSSDKTIRDKVKVVSHIAAASKGEVLIPKRRMMRPSEVISVGTQLEVDAIVIDGVYLMHSDLPTHSRWERVADVSNALKQGALELGIPILGLSQLRRLGGKQEADTEDIAYSDALGQDADIIMALTPVEEAKNRVQLELIKSRFGVKIGTTLLLDFDSMVVVDEGGAA